MRKVFEVELSSENGGAKLTLPAAPYALLDALEKLELADGGTPRWELLSAFGAGYIFQHMDQDNGSLSELNALAQQLARLSESEMTVFEGLAAMERSSLGQPFPLARMIDLAYSTECCYLLEGVVTDAQLGRFCAENGFIPEADSLPDAAFELLDFERIGRQFRESEGGVFTRGGYVQRHDELKQVYKDLDLTLKKPDYAGRQELENAIIARFWTEPEKEETDRPPQRGKSGQNYDRQSRQGGSAQTGQPLATFPKRQDTPPADADGR